MLFIWIFVSLYIAAYLVCFCFPQLLHKRRAYKLCEGLIKAAKPANIAHRGGLLENYENSVKAFVDSSALGIEGLEMDLHCTKDGHLIVAHDHNLARTTGQPQLIRDLQLAQVGGYLDEVPSGFSTDTFRKINKDKERPPRFAEVLEALKNDKRIFLNVDIKTNRLEDLADACKLLSAFGFQDRAIIGCVRNEQSKEHMRAGGFDYPSFFTLREILKFFLSLVLGVLPFMSFRGDVLEIAGPFLTLTKNEMFKKYRKVRAIFWILRIFAWAVPLLNWHFNRRGIPVIYWTLNGEEDFGYAVALKANGIITDTPAHLKRFLMAK